MQFTFPSFLFSLKVVQKELLTAGLLHGNCLTVTGKTLAENLSNVLSLSELNQVRSNPDTVIMISLIVDFRMSSVH